MAKNLPKASNFYISYFILYGLASSSRYLVNIAGLLRLWTRRFKDKSPRKMFNTYIKLRTLKWGEVYPKFANLGVIAITYSIIAPLILGFATVGMLLIYMAFRYNILYVFDNGIDTKGVSYAQAMQHLTVGVYLSELCLIGLFAIRCGSDLISIGPLILMVFFLILTILWHIVMRRTLFPLIEHIPRNLFIENSQKDPMDESSTFADVPQSQLRIDDADVRSIHTTSQLPFSELGQGTNLRNRHSIRRKPIDQHADTNVSRFDRGPSSTPANNYLISHFYRILDFFQPNKSTPAHIAARLDSKFRTSTPCYGKEMENEAYLNPVFKWKLPRLWIVQDEIGVSKREIDESCRDVKGLEIFDDGAKFDDKNRITVKLERLRALPLWEERIVY